MGPLHGWVLCSWSPMAENQAGCWPRWSALGKNPLSSSLWLLGESSSCWLFTKSHFQLLEPACHSLPSHLLQNLTVASSRQAEDYLLFQISDSPSLTSRCRLKGLMCVQKTHLGNNLFLQVNCAI